MTDLQTIILIAHTLIALAIIVLVLLQRGKGATAGAAFGSGASGTVFGARGSSNFFSRATAVMATVFFASSLTLAYLSSQRATSVDSLLESAEPLERTEEAPAAEDTEGLPDLTLDAGDESEIESVEPEAAADDEPAAEAVEEAVPEDDGEQ